MPTFSARVMHANHCFHSLIDEVLKAIERQFFLQNTNNVNTIKAKKEA
jgi:hypothetical protein